MPSNDPDRAKLRKAYSLLRARLLAERKLEEARVAQSRETLSRIDRELASWRSDAEQREEPEVDVDHVSRLARIV